MVQNASLFPDAWLTPDLMIVRILVTKQQGSEERSTERKAEYFYRCYDNIAARQVMTLSQ